MKRLSRDPTTHSKAKFDGYSMLFSSSLHRFERVYTGRSYLYCARGGHARAMTREDANFLHASLIKVPQRLRRVISRGQEELRVLFRDSP
jgi:hypothetical protein